MPRQKMEAVAMGSLLEELELGAIMEVYPRPVVVAVLDETKTNSFRQRLMPAYLVLYLVIMLSFHPEASVRETLRIVLDQLRGVHGAGSTKIPAFSAITKARKKLSTEPLRRLFHEVVRPLGLTGLKGCFWRGRRLVAAGGTAVEVQNTGQNVGRFGVRTSRQGGVGHPSLKVATVVECGTGVIFAAQWGGVHDDERALFDHLVGRLEADMLLMCDRYYYDYPRWKRCQPRCALLWRMRKNTVLKPLEELADGSFLARVNPSDELVEKGACKKGEWVETRKTSFNEHPFFVEYV